MKFFSRFSSCCDNNKTSHKGNPFHFLQNMRVSPFLYESDGVCFLKGVSRLHLLCVWENWFKNGEPSTCEDSRKFSKEPTMLSIPNPSQLYNFGFSDPTFCLKLSLLNSNVQILILVFWYANIAARQWGKNVAWVATSFLLGFAFFSVQFPDFLILIFPTPQAGVEARVCPENYLIMAEAGERLAFSLGCGKDKDKEKTKANTKTNQKTKTKKNASHAERWELPDNGWGGRKVGFYGRLPS